MDINEMASRAYEHAKASGFHDRHPLNVELEDTTDDWLDRVRDHVMVKLALVTTEVAEAIEEVRSNEGPLVSYYDDKGKPEGLNSELADILIRVGDLAASYGIDLEGAVLEKMTYNESRGRMHGKFA